MSGDIGAGTAQAAVNLLQRRRGQLPPGPLQLAGGTNHDSRRRLEREGLAPAVAGIAYGGSARKLIQPLLQRRKPAGRRCALALIYGGRPWRSSSASSGVMSWPETARTQTGRWMLHLAGEGSTAASLDHGQ